MVAMTFIQPATFYGTLAPAFFIALGSALLLVPLVWRLALRFGLIDQPDERKIHQTPIPRLGGVGVWLAFMLALGAVAWWIQPLPHGQALSGILAGGALLFLLGLLDDLFQLSPYVKLAGQLLAASVAFVLGVQINTLDLPGSAMLVLNGLSFPITVLWLVGVTNSLNFIDGVDGLAGGVITMSALTLAVVAGFTHQPLAALLATLLAGANLGFLVFNFHPARIFMGDSGALFSGFTLAAIAVTGVLKTPIVVMLLPILVLSVPLLDITYSTFRRLFRGSNPFLPDADHIHHRLLKAGLSQVRTVLALYGVCFIAGILATSYVDSLRLYLVTLAAVAAIGVGLTVLVRWLAPAAATGQSSGPPAQQS
jgi:UDP-GlcNAc:undecaprenyl-phosphate GlcNAc-1-phosphate transferase